MVHFPSFHHTNRNAGHLPFKVFLRKTLQHRGNSTIYLGSRCECTPASCHPYNISAITDNSGNFLYTLYTVTYRDPLGPRGSTSFKGYHIFSRPLELLRVVSPGYSPSYSNLVTTQFSAVGRNLFRGEGGILLEIISEWVDMEEFLIVYVPEANIFPIWGGDSPDLPQLRP